MVMMLMNMMMDDCYDVTGETTTREIRKRRSATQSAARRWWNTEAIDLNDDHLDDNLDYDDHFEDDIDHDDHYGYNDYDHHHDYADL